MLNVRRDVSDDCFRGLVGLQTVSSGRMARRSDCRNRLVGLVDKVSASRGEGPGSIPALSMRIIPGGVIPVTSELVLQ